MGPGGWHRRTQDLSCLRQEPRGCAVLQDRKTGQGGPGRNLCFNSGRKTWKLGQKMNADLFDDFDGLK